MKTNDAIILFLCVALVIIVVYFTMTRARTNKFNDVEMDNPIFRIFNINLDDAAWDEHLDNVQKANGKWVLISPMQMHNNIRTQWWSRYQPTSYLYSEKTLALLSILCTKAASRNLNIMMDVVWNHTTILNYTNETKHRYHEKNVMQPGVAEHDETKSWLSDGLPDLNTELDEIKEEAVMAVTQCRNAGVKGFRIDTFHLIDDAFFDHVFKYSPQHELHLYEVSYGTRYINRMTHRINADGCEVVFYDTSAYGKISDMAKQIMNTNETVNVLQTFPPSDHLMNAALNQDMIMSFNNNDPFYLFIYFMISKFVQSDKYFVYSIFSFEETSITTQHLLFNWDNYFKAVEPILRVKKEAPAVIGTVSVHQLANASPMIVGSLGKNYKMLINLKRANNDVTTDEISCSMLFGQPDSSRCVLRTMLKNAKPLQIKNGMVYVPDNSYTIVKKENDDDANRLATNLIFFWHQGWDAAPQYAKDAVAIWKTYENGNVICLDRMTIVEYLSASELKTIEHIERCIPKPYLYAVVCDYVLERMSGIYIDCDVYPTGTTIYLLNCYYEYDRIVLGRESGENKLVNNAFIIVPPSCRSFVRPIKTAMMENVFALNVSTFSKSVHSTDGIGYEHDTYATSASDDAIFKWVIENTGPGFLKKVTSVETTSNQFMVLDSSWLYANYELDNKKNMGQTCSKNMGLIQHCYVGDWRP